jgi:hypothetical protein
MVCGTLGLAGGCGRSSLSRKPAAISPSAPPSGTMITLRPPWRFQVIGMRTVIVEPSKVPLVAIHVARFRSSMAPGSYSTVVSEAVEPIGEK